MKDFFLEEKTYIAIPVWKLYESYIGKEKWILVSEKSEDDLIDEFGPELNAFSPWVLITVEQFSAMVEWQRNEKKHIRRSYMQTYYYGVDDNYCEKLLGEERAKGTSVEDHVFFDTQGCLNCLEKLTDIQRKRVISHILDEMSFRDIAKEEGKSYTAIKESVNYGIKKIKKYYQDQT